MTRKELEKRLEMIRYYDFTIDNYKHINNTSSRFYVNLSPQAKEEIKILIDRTCNEIIDKCIRFRSEAISLLDHAGSDTDKDLLYRLYVLHQNLFDIAEAMFYSYTYIESKKSNALRKLAKNLKDHAAGEY